MRRLACLLTLVVLVIPAPAWAAPGSSVVAQRAGLAERGVAVPSLSYRPFGFTADAAQAMAAAKATLAMRALHHHYQPLWVQPYVNAQRQWSVAFAFHNLVVGEVVLTPSGRVLHAYTGPLAAAPYARGHYAPIFDSPWVVVPFAVLFLVPFVNPRRVRRSRAAIDAVAVLSFLVSYWLFNHGHLEAAVWLVYPPLLYLLARTGAIGMGWRRSGGDPASWLSLRTCAGGLLVLVVARTVLSLIQGEVIDVGYASVSGAFRLAHGLPLYYANVGHFDTYGPVTYLAYLPFELLFPFHGRWDSLPAAHAATLTFDLLTIGLLVLLGRRLRPGRDGLRLGLALAWGWAACPFTLLALMKHSNDSLIAMLIVLGLLAFHSPMLRGMSLGLATAAKFSPAALLAVFAGGRRPGWRAAVLTTAAFAAVVALAIGLYLPAGGVPEFWHHTIGFQLSRPDVFSPWALHPGLAWLKRALAVLAVAGIAILAVRPRERTLAQVAALGAAATIAIQLPAVHWFYYYILWFLPLLLVASLTPEPVAELVPAADPPAAPAERVQPVLVGV